MLLCSIEARRAGFSEETADEWIHAMFSAQAVTRICIVVLNYSIPSFLSLLTQSVGGTRANPSLVRPSFEKGVEGFAKEDYDLIRPLSALLGSYVPTSDIFCFGNG